MIHKSTLKTIARYLGLLVPWLIFYVLIMLFDTDDRWLPWSDLHIYHRVGSAVLNGEIPYRDISFEYPPASAIPFTLPALISQSIHIYRRVFEILSLFMAYGASIFGAGIVDQVGKRKNNIVSSIIFYFIQTSIFLILIQLVISKFDMFAVFLTTLGIFCYLKYTNNNKSIYSVLAVSLLTLAGLIKLYPLFIIPLIFLKELKSQQIAPLKRLIVVTIVTTLPFALLVIIGWQGFRMDFLQYHGERGLEIESIYSTILLFLNQIGLIKDITIVYTHASYGIDGYLPQIMAKISLPIFAIIYVLTLYKLYKQSWRNRASEKLLLSSTVIIMLFVLTNKVFSAQYQLWFFPLLTTAAFMVPDKAGLRIIGVGIFTSFITILIFPTFWSYYQRGDLLLTALLLTRNVALMITMGYLYKVIFSERIEENQ